ncbi:MAG: hypothetical protein ACI910_001775 [Oleispira sp.]|jgi:hypothetical protein
MLNYRTQVSAEDGVTLYGFWPLRTNETCTKWLKSVDTGIIGPHEDWPVCIALFALNEFIKRII